MNESKLIIDNDAINHLLKSFYEITKFKIVIFDPSFNEIAAYPKDSCRFCSICHQHDILLEKCNKSNNDALSSTIKSREPTLYKCHAGLYEATFPIVDSNNNLLGIIMIGQVSDEDENNIQKSLSSYLNKYSIFLDNYDHLLSTPKKTINEIKSAQNVLEACTLYLALKKTLEFEQNTFITNLDNYIDSHLKGNLSIEILMDEFNMSKNGLYNAFSRYSNIGIAEYIKTKRLEKAKSLLINTKLTVKEISDEIGFNDYNYFCRIFKSTYKMPAKKYRLRNTRN